MRKKINNEEGSATIEFLGMVPLVLLIAMILWQFLVAGYAVIVTQSALNEAAKTYSVTANEGEARAAAQDLINKAGGNLELRHVNPIPGAGNDFTMQIAVYFRVEFIPKKIVGSLPKVGFTRELSGRVME